MESDGKAGDNFLEKEIMYPNNTSFFQECTKCDSADAGLHITYDTCGLAEDSTGLNDSPNISYVITKKKSAEVVDISKKEQKNL